MKTKKKGLVAALSVTLASAILISASAATLYEPGAGEFTGTDGAYNGEKVSEVKTVLTGVPGTRDGAVGATKVGDLIVIPKDYSAGDQAAWSYNTGDVSATNFDDGAVVGWKIMAEETDIADLKDDEVLFTFDVKFHAKDEGNGPGDVLMDFTVKDYKDAPKDEEGFGTFVQKMTYEDMKACGLPDTIDTMAFIEGRLRTGKLAELTVGAMTLYNVDAAGAALVGVQTPGKTFNGGSVDPEPGKSSAKDITSFKLAGVAGTITGTSIKVELPKDTDLTNVAAEATVSAKATIAPDPATVKDFSKDVKFTVTAEDGSTKEYTVTATVKKDEAPAAKVIEEVKGDQVTGGGNQGKPENGVLSFGPGEGGSREFNVPAVNVTAGTVYKVGLFLTISEVKNDDWTVKVRPQNEFYYLTQNKLIYDMKAGGTQKVIISVPFKAAGDKMNLNTILEGFTGSIDKVVLATNDYDFGKNQGDYKLVEENGYQEIKDAAHPQYPRYEGSALAAGDPGKSGEGWKPSTKAGGDEKPDPQPQPTKDILKSINGSEVKVDIDGIHFTEEKHKANIKGTAYDFSNYSGALYGFDFNDVKLVKDTTYKMAFYLTLTGIDEGKEGADIKFRPANEHYFNLKNEEVYNTEVGGTQKVIISVPIKYNGTALEGYVWHSGGLHGTLDKIALSDANYNFGVSTDDYYLISEDVANAGSNKDPMIPAEGTWKPSTIEEIKAATTNPDPSDPTNPTDPSNPGGGNGNGGNGGNPVTGAAGVAAGTVMLAAAAAATLVLSRKKRK